MFLYSPIVASDSNNAIASCARALILTRLEADTIAYEETQKKCRRGEEFLETQWHKPKKKMTREAIAGHEIVTSVEMIASLGKWVL